MKKKSKVLIIGSSSFIVDSLNNHIIKHADPIYISSKKNTKLSHFYLNFKKKIINKTLIQKISKIKFDSIVIFSHYRNNKNFLKSVDNNLLLSSNISHFINSLSFKKIIYISSFSVYSNKLLLKNKFEINSFENLDNIYGFSKSLVENYYYNCFRNKLTILRIPNILDYHKNNKSIHLRSKSLKLNKKIIYEKKYFVSIDDLNKNIKRIINKKVSKFFIYNCYTLKTSIKKASFINNK